MRILALTLLMVVFAAGASAQAIAEAQKIDEFGLIGCCDLGARVDNAEIARQNTPGSKIYYIFYEGKKRLIYRWNAKTGKREDVLLNPVRAEFQSFERGIKRQVNFLRRDMNQMVIQNGGYRELLTIEVWIVPDGAEPPALTPTLDEKSVKFRKGRWFFAGVCDAM